jgi:hypothetical protein
MHHQRAMPVYLRVASAGSAESIILCGVVHAYVTQKLVKSNKIKSFNQCPKHNVQTLFQQIQMQYDNHSDICYSFSQIPSTNYILTLIKPFSFI